MAALQVFVGNGGAIGLWAGGVACSINGWIFATVMPNSDGMAWGMLALYGVLLPIGLVASLVRTVRWQRLYRHGRLAFGRLIQKETVGTTKNRRYRLTFEYRDVEEERIYHPHHVPRRRGKVEVQDTGKVTDEPEEPLLFDPSDPEKIMMLDSLVGYVRVGDRGDIVARGWFLTLMLVVATLSVGSLLTLLAWLEGSLQTLLG